jgi:Carboxypeptidase regulatory-like domain
VRRIGGHELLIDQVDRELTAWVSSVLTGVAVSLAAPLDRATGIGVSVYLLRVVKAPPARGGRGRPVLQLTLSYLVTTWSEDPEESHRMLGELAFAALAHTEYEVEMDPAALAVWRAFGIAPRPSFTLSVRLQREWPAVKQPIVRSAVAVQGSVAATVSGLVVGPGDVPVTGARVECPALNRVTRTDGKGRFRLAAVPAAPPPQFLVTAKGQQRWVSPDLQALGGQPLVIRFDGLE